MKKLNINSKKGFTIIEVVLVLAIAGLIFLMIFIALPNLQRTQKDTTRRNDLDRASSSLIQYVANNNKLPALNGTSHDQTTYVSGGDILENTAYRQANAWTKFYWSYLLANGDDTFEDPDGGYYNLVAIKCVKSTTKITINGIDRYACSNNEAATATEGQPLYSNYSIDNFKTASGAGNTDSKYTMVIASNAMCGSEDEVNGSIVYAEGTRKFAVVMRLEGTGVYCVNN